MPSPYIMRIAACNFRLYRPNTATDGWVERVQNASTYTEKVQASTTWTEKVQASTPWTERTQE
jgi:hypothetical protein